MGKSNYVYFANARLIVRRFTKGPGECRRSDLRNNQKRQLIFAVQRQVLRDCRIRMFEFCEQAGVGEIEGMRVVPVVVGYLVQTVHDLGVAYFNGKFAAAVKTPRGEVDRTNDRSCAIGIE